jgi:hypothetical protein
MSSSKPTASVTTTRAHRLATQRAGGQPASAATGLDGQGGVDASPPPAVGATDSLWPLVETVIAPTTLLVALAYYVGRQYTTARSSYFGIDASLLGFSGQDNFVRIADPLFIPLGALALAGLVCVEIDAFAGRVVDLSLRSRPRILAFAIGTLPLTGAGLLSLGIYAAVNGLPEWPSYLVASLLPAAGILLIVLGARVDQRRSAAIRARAKTTRASARDTPATDAMRALSGAATPAPVRAESFGRRDHRREAVLDGVGVRGGTRYGPSSGARGAPRSLVCRRGLQPQPLLFAGPGVQERAVTVSASRYRYRYDGLRFVIRSGGAYSVDARDICCIDRLAWKATTNPDTVLPVGRTGAV